MTEKFRASEIELKKNFEILDGTFSKFGFEVMNVGIEYADMLGGKGIKFFCEIMSNEDMPEDAIYHIKVNVYNNNGDLISMGSDMIDTNDFTGYDTLEVVVFHESIHGMQHSINLLLVYILQRSNLHVW